ncbi:MAG: hypothetical protein FK730_03170 [Asgard group archaeon]|nr:hypothetical protein [Asgard group archaeon]
MLYLILYITAFFVTSIIYVILYGSKRREFPLFGEKFHEIPTNYIRSLKLIPTLIVVLFVSFTAPRYDYFFILIILAFLFTFLGDLGVIKNNFIGLAFYLFTHLFLSIAYITQIIQFSVKPIGTYSLIGIGVIIYLAIISCLYRFLNVNLKDKYNRTTIVVFVVFFYLAILFLNIITAAILILNYYNSSKGIIIIIFGAVLYLISDISIFIREASQKQKYSVLLIMSTYYLALLCISLITQFY